MEKKRAAKPLLPVKSDFVFKLIFGDQRNVDILAAFLKSILDIPDEEYKELTIVDPHIKKESEEDKYGVLDVKLHTVSGSIIHIEIQLKVVPDVLKARTIYSQSKLITEQMSSGMKWSDIKRSITIVITDELFIPKGKKYHHQFRYRTKDGMEFTDLVEINTLDLRKLPSDNDSTELWYWMKFIKADNEEDIEMIAQKSPQMRRAVGVLKKLSADERTRMLYEKQEMARIDAETLADYERKRAEAYKEEIAKSKEEIAKSKEEIAKSKEEIAKKDEEIKRLREQLKANSSK